VYVVFVQAYNVVNPDTQACCKDKEGEGEGEGGGEGEDVDDSAPLASNLSERTRHPDAAAWRAERGGLPNIRHGKWLFYG
jgi:hypothetical protein